MAHDRDWKPGDRIACIVPDGDLLTGGAVYTVRMIPRKDYVSLEETPGEVFFQQSRFELRF